MNLAFTFTLTFFSKYHGSKAGWEQTHIELGSRFGWNFFTRTRYWNKNYSELLPPVTKLRLRTVEYYGEKEEKIWNFLEKKYDYYKSFDGTPKTKKEIGPMAVRMRQTIYRFPLLTITNTYHTKLDEVRLSEFMKEINKNLDE